MSAVQHEYKRSLTELPEFMSRSSESHVYLDFDYTLFRSSSTEEFLNTGKPAFLAALALRVLRGFQPWTFGARTHTGFVWRDPIRIWMIILLMPWTVWLFRKRAPALFEQYKNQSVIDALSGVPADRITIVSVGFERFVRQLLAGTRLQDARIIGSSLTRPAALRRRGKLHQLRELGIAPNRNRDVVVSDSLDDADLLSSVDNAFLIDPDLTGVQGAFEDVYVPFYYTARVKRSTGFVVKQIFLEELIVILLATAFFQPFSLGVWLGAAAFFIAFFAVYEIGYAENDRIGHISELKPKLSQDYDRFRHVSLEPEAWYWSVALTVTGALLLGPEIASDTLRRLGLVTTGSETLNTVLLMAVWMAIICIGRVVFFVYNRLPMTWRVFAYLPLHFVKYFGLVLILPSEPAGYALLYAQIVRTWSLYAIRRCDGDIEIMASQLVRLAFFLMLLFALALAAPAAHPFEDWHTWIILAWCVVRAIPEARRKLFSREGLRSGLRKESPGTTGHDGPAKAGEDR